MNERVTLVTVANGAALELFEHELARVLDNIADINTAPRAGRSITIKIDFKPDEDRLRSDVSVEVKSKLAGIRPARREVFFGKQDGKRVAMQGNPAQGTIFDPPQTNGPAEVRTFDRKQESANDR